jgi:hypothetical protein
LSLKASVRNAKTLLASRLVEAVPPDKELLTNRKYPTDKEEMKGRRRRWRSSELFIPGPSGEGTPTPIGWD